MGIPNNKYIQFLRSSKKKRRQLACFVTALSVFVSGGVFWQLRGIGTAMVDENLPNADDSGEAITVTPLNASELETQDVWEATLPPLTDIAGENLARIAESQLGYSESSVNFVHAEDGETHNGYTRYGAWYGNPYGEWNTMFTYFCLNYAGVSSDDIPYGSGCWAWSLELDKAGLIVPVTRGSPARGDILLIDSDLDGKADRSCIVQSVSDDEISAVEGDIDGSVALTSYLIGYEQLLGMVSLADIVPEPTVLPEEPAEVDFSAESESGITVEAHADRDAFPPDTEMFVFDISQDEAVQAAADHFGDEAPDDIQAVAVDITFRSPDGEELEPAEDSQVRVSIVLPEEQSLSGGEFSLLHVSDDGDVQEVADADVSADSADFVAESFSVYVLTSNSTPSDSDLVALSKLQPGSPGSSADNPYIIGVGEHITVFSDVKATGNGFTIRDNNNDNDDKNTLIRDSNHPNNVDTQQGQYAYYVGNDSDSAIIQFDGTAMVYVKVIDHPIYLNTALGERHIDNLHEYLALLHSGHYHNHPEWFVLDDKGDPKYIKNNDTNITGGNGDGAFGPYRISVGDVIEVVTYCSPSEKDSLDFAVGQKGSHQEGTALLEKVGDSTVERIESGAHAGEYRISAKFRAKATNNNKRTGIEFGDSFFYICVTDDSTTMTHADIEIADGGTYKVEKTKIDADGKVTKTITEYDAYVDNVNHCFIKNSQGEVIQTFLTEHYYRHGTTGSSQYELTSNYLASTEGAEGAMKIGDGRYVTLRGDKNYNLKEAQKAEFDVQLLLKPKTITTIVNDGTPTVEDISSQEPTTISSVKFNLERRDIIDAYNKCPVHTGLDFTIKANLNEVLTEQVLLYTLPATGGTGELPYILFGSAMLAGAFTLLFIRRKKAAAR